MSLKRGQQFETLACQYLQAAGLQLLATNVRCPFGELDLVMRHQDCLVFVEVKYRKSTAYGSAATMVTASKQQKLRTTANWYLQQQQWRGPARFDVVSIEGDSAPWQFNWFRNAF